MAAVTQADLGVVQTNINRIEERIAQINRNFEQAGREVPDLIDVKAVELRTLMDQFRMDVQSYATQAMEQHQRHQAAIQEHHAALNQLPAMVAEIFSIKETSQGVNARVEDVIASLDQKFRKIDEANNVKDTELRTRLETLKAYTDQAVASANQTGSTDPWHRSIATPQRATGGVWNSDEAGASTVHSSAGKGFRGNEYFPMKRAVPETLKDKAEDWRAWRDDTMDYFDNVTPGMRDLLVSIHALEEAPTLQEVVKMGKEMGLDSIIADQKKIWRALKKLTEGEAKGIVISVKDEDGYTAWHRLAGQFEPSLVARRGEVLADISVMSRTLAKSLLGTKRLLNAFQNKRKLVEDITGVDLDGNHVLATLLGFVDGTTKQHTVKDLLRDAT